MAWGGTRYCGSVQQGGRKWRLEGGVGHGVPWIRVSHRTGDAEGSERGAESDPLVASKVPKQHHIIYQVIKPLRLLVLLLDRE